jgi:hypothetical protein
VSSDGDWGQATPEVQDALDQRRERWLAQTTDFPPAGENVPLDTFLERKGLERGDLLRVGGRYLTWGGEPSLAYLFPDGIKYRTLTDPPRRASEEGATWLRFKLVPASAERRATEAIVAEGETDGAMLSKLAPHCDVLITPNGAAPDNVTREPMLEQLKRYERVYVALDDDKAGNEGAAALLDRASNTVRLRPPAGKDWCEAQVEGEIPDDWAPATAFEQRPRSTWSIRELLELDLGTYEDNNWFTDPILPVNGSMMLHARKKSLKSVVLLDLLRAVATGTPFAGSYGFCRPSGPGRVLLFQYEVPPWNFQQRTISFMRGLDEQERELLGDNFHVFGMGDNKLPRLRVDDKDEWLERVVASAQEVEAEVLAFDPIQRMTGGRDTAKAHEIDSLLDGFARLQQEGFTVVFCHHNNKAGGRGAKDADAASGSQRFGADPDSLCSLWHGKGMVDDDNSRMVKERNFTWELRNGAARGRSVTVQPDPANPELMLVRFDELIVGGADDDGDLPDFA